MMNLLYLISYFAMTIFNYISKQLLLQRHAMIYMSSKIGNYRLHFKKQL